MEILACPHCDRLFHATPAVLGRKIRCRGCARIFHVPKDTTNVPLGPAVGAADGGHEEAPAPVAIASVREGRDVRSCPGCGRTFAMKPELAGKTIRCRDCKAPFRVTASGDGQVGAELARPPAAPAPQPAGGPPPLRPPYLQPPPLPSAVSAAAPAPATVSPDVGEVLGDLQPGEQVASVVRPRNHPPKTGSGNEALASLIAVVLGAMCAPPVAQLILWWIIQQDPFGIGPALPDSLEWMAPEQFRN